MIILIGLQKSNFSIGNPTNLIVPFVLYPSVLARDAVVGWGGCDPSPCRAVGGSCTSDRLTYFSVISLSPSTLPIIMFPCGFAVTQSFVTGTNELMVPGRVTSSCAIPQGSTTEVIEAKSLRGQPDISQVSKNYKNYLKL